MQNTFKNLIEPFATNVEIPLYYHLYNLFLKCLLLIMRKN